MRHAVITLMIITAYGCAAPVDIEYDVDFGPLRISPQVGIDQEQLEHAALKWEDATGIEIQVTPWGGVPVSLVDELDDCGKTFSLLSDSSIVEIKIWNTTDQRCSVAHTLLHELGHAVCRNRVLGDFECHSHGKKELMYIKSNNRMAIDEPSLTEVCSHAACVKFAPEMP